MIIIEEIKNIKSSRKELKQFATVMAVVSCVLGGLFLWQQKSYYPYLLVASIVFFILGRLAPILLKPIQKIWMSLACVMNFIMTRLILSIMFFLVFTPISLFAKLFGKELLDLKIDKNKLSYWNYRKKKEFKQSDYERQF